MLWKLISPLAVSKTAREDVSQRDRGSRCFPIIFKQRNNTGGVSKLLHAAEISTREKQTIIQDHLISLERLAI
jgi:hypothetical protein